MLPGHAPSGPSAKPKSSTALLLQSPAQCGPDVSGRSHGVPSRAQAQLFPPLEIGRESDAAAFGGRRVHESTKRPENVSDRFVVRV
jgi:hypothetical protein